MRRRTYHIPEDERLLTMEISGQYEAALFCPDEEDLNISDEETTLLDPFKMEIQSSVSLQYESDLLSDIKTQESSSVDTFDDDWQGYDLSYPSQCQQKQQLSAESYSYLERKAKAQIILAEVADIIQKNLNLRCFAEQLYYFDGMIWKALSDDGELRYLTNDFLDVQDFLSKSQFVEIFNILRSRRRNLKELRMDDKAMQDKINFSNGVYDLQTDTISDHSPEYPFTSYLPYSFQPGEIGKGDVFDGYLDSVCLDDPSIRKRILQWIAFCISNLPNVKKIALLIGARDSGKTTLARLIAMIVGEENCQAFSFDHIGRFSNDEMFGKKIGLCTDLKGSRLSSRSIEWIKNQTGGDIVHAEVKHNPDSYSYVSTCKYIIASNFRPDLSEDNALENRLLTIPFPYPVPDDKKNPNLLSDLKQEMQHILYLSLQELRSFLDDGMQFADIGDWEDYVPKHFSDQETSAGKFFQECCYLQKGIKTGRKEVYGHYLTYCDRNNQKAMTDSEFFRYFKKIMYEHNIKDDTNNGRRYNGLALKDPIDGHANMDSPTGLLSDDEMMDQINS